MTEKIFGITVKDNIPYVRNIFFVNNPSINNNTITGITKIIYIDDNSKTEDEFLNKLILAKPKTSNDYSGSFHLFVNEDFTNGYYTTGNIVFQPTTTTTTITSTNTFINKFTTKDIINEIEPTLEQPTTVVSETNKQHLSIVDTALDILKEFINKSKLSDTQPILSTTPTIPDVPDVPLDTTPPPATEISTQIKTDNNIPLVETSLDALETHKTISNAPTETPLETSPSSQVETAPLETTPSQPTNNNIAPIVETSLDVLERYKTPSTETTTLPPPPSPEKTPPQVDTTSLPPSPPTNNNIAPIVETSMDLLERHNTIPTTTETTPPTTTETTPPTTTETTPPTTTETTPTTTETTPTTTTETTLPPPPTETNNETEILSEMKKLNADISNINNTIQKYKNTKIE